MDFQPDGASFTNDPIWSIGTVMPNATNTWSDGYQVGLWVEVPVCAGTSPFWETADPSEETQWSCEQIFVYVFYSVLVRYLGWTQAKVRGNKKIIRKLYFVTLIRSSSGHELRESPRERILLLFRARRV